jgi:hypothetical protein
LREMRKAARARLNGIEINPTTSSTNAVIRLPPSIGASPAEIERSPAQAGEAEPNHHQRTEPRAGQV